MSKISAIPARSCSQADKITSKFFLSSVELLKRHWLPEHFADADSIYLPFDFLAGGVILCNATTGN
jgi:hypothetical protein